MIFKALNILLLVIFAAGVTFAFGGDDKPVWRPVTPEELSMTTAKVEPGADAEAIFWEVKIDDKKEDKLTYEHYIRIKIFTEKGRETFSKMDIAFEKGDKVEDVAARVIKPDGSIVELDPNEVYEQEIIKADKLKIHSKSFAVPGIAPGVIVEYQYRQILKNEAAGGKKLIFQRDIPVQQMAYYVRPAKGSRLAADFYNMPETNFVPADDGFYVARLSSVPAFHEEPYMPPRDLMRKWARLKYSGETSLFSLFLTFGYDAMVQRMLKPNKAVKAKVAELTSGISSGDEKARRIFAFVQNDIKNLSFDPAWTAQQIEKQKIEEPEDVLKKSMGNSFMIGFLFMALANEAGLDPRLLLAGDRNNRLYGSSENPSITELSFAGFAVKTDGKYAFVNPGIPFLPYGRLFWYNEGTPGTLIGNGGSISVQIPSCPYQESRSHRVGEFQLNDDGSLEGTIKIEYYGQPAITRRIDQFNDTDAEKEEDVKAEIKKLSSAAEISAISIDHFKDTASPLTYSLKLRIPNYAQKTGKRLFLQPAVFEYGSTAVFTSNDRKYSISFPWPWSEDDEIDIHLPKGYALESADAPNDVADRSDIGRLHTSFGYNKDTATLRVQRSFHFGGGGHVLFPVTVYPALKAMFDNFQTVDSHIITLKQAEK